jgi:hypothetical protein
VTWPAFASVRAFLPVALATLSADRGARLTLASLAPRFFFFPRPDDVASPWPLLNLSAICTRVFLLAATGQRGHVFPWGHLPQGFSFYLDRTTSRACGSRLTLRAFASGFFVLPRPPLRTCGQFALKFVSARALALLRCGLYP